MDITTRLVYLGKRRGFGWISWQVLASFFHVDFPATVEVGHNFQFLHRGMGTIIHPAVRFGDDVTVMPHVAIGMADPFTRIPREEAPLIHIGNGAVIGIGARIMAPRSGLTVGDGTWVGANAVLLESTGHGEVWAGVPARRIR